MHRLINTILILFFIGIIFFIGYTSGKKGVATTQEQFVSLENAKLTRTDEGNRDVDFSLFWDAWDALEEKYIARDDVNTQDLVYGAISGMMKATDDPYTVFLDPEQNKALDEDLGGEFEGIGAEIDVRENILMIVTPLIDSPAQKAGLRAGDRILAIDGEPTIDILVEEAVKKIRGKRGSVVTLQVFRDGEDDTRDIAITRDIVHIESVRFEMRDEGLAHIRVTQFGEETFEEFVAALESAQKQNARGLIIDVRNNPGGSLLSVIDIASTLLPRNSVVVIEQNHNKKQKKIFARPKYAVAYSIPTVVLINQGSASAAEILAGALRDNRDEITIIGETSFGKGSVQEVAQLKGGSAAKITIAQWLTPKGVHIAQKGIDPDVEVEFTQEDVDADRDPQFDKAVEILKEKL